LCKYLDSLLYQSNTSTVLSTKVMRIPFNQHVERLLATLLVKGKLASVVYRSWRAKRSNEHDPSIKQDVLGRTDHMISPQIEYLIDVVGQNFISCA
jgi:hypothetical protein